MRKQTNGKMKKIKYILGCIGTALMFSACSDFLDVATQNGLDPDQANDAERFCNAAYASLMNQRDVKLWAWEMFVPMMLIKAVAGQTTVTRSTVMKRVRIS